MRIRTNTKNGFKKNAQNFHSDKLEMSKYKTKNQSRIDTEPYRIHRKNQNLASKKLLQMRQLPYYYETIQNFKLSIYKPCMNLFRQDADTEPCFPFIILVIRLLSLNFNTKPPIFIFKNKLLFPSDN